MNGETLKQRLIQRYRIQPDYPWARFPDYAVFRHPHNRKWFALLAPVRADKLGLQGLSEEEGQALREIVNVKAPPELIGSLRLMPGVLPGYHANKEHWLSLLLDTADEQVVMDLIEDSFFLTHGRSSKPVRQC